MYFATAFQLGGVASGIVAESNMGRPTKLDGNPDHPGSLGGSNVLAQASVLDLYDPDRSQVVTNAGLVSSWDMFLNQFIVEVSAQGLTGGSGLRVLTETITSPLMKAQLATLLENNPDAKWIQYEPVNRDNAREGALIAFGEDVNPVYHFDQAKVIVSLEADFMAPGTPGDVRYAHDFAAMRRVRNGGTPEMNRLYVAESTPTITGTMADHRLPLKSAQIKGLALALAAAVGADVEAPADLHGVPDEWIAAAAADLQEHAGQSLVLAGPGQPPIVHAVAHAINQVLGNAGQTVTYTDPLEVSTNQTESLRELVDDMNNGKVSVLVIIDANPVYNAPGDLNFAEAMQNVNYRVRLGLFEDETSALCQWHVPAKHYLESWSDGLAYDGTVTLTQPLINPLYPVSKNANEILAAMIGAAGSADFDLVHDYWAKQSGAANFEKLWRESLFNGFIADSAPAPKSVNFDPNRVRSKSVIEARQPAAAEGLELVYRPDPGVFDGRFANNGWLQELPKPHTKLTWDNAALISPRTAEKLGVASEDMIILDVNKRTVFAPVWVTPGQADDSVTLHLGYGRTRAGRVGDNIGANAYKLRASDAPWFDPALEIRRTSDTYKLASTQLHWQMDGRHIVKEGTLEMYKEDPHFVEHIGEHEADPNLTLMPPEWEYNSYAWGMVVDLAACNGCNACVVSCQAENNIPVVGKEQVLVGREMHWMRVDTYHEGNIDNPETVYQPMMCHHCEQAPCELVCPVAATVHDHEGLNVMVYNRCIGTRYCSNNCPYKVRRFNYLHFSDEVTESLKGQRNPNVTVRTRGVMEKCTYCVQRISRGRIAAKNENRRIQDGEVMAACQTACPTNAIVFGDLNDPNSAVAQAAAQPQNYSVLAELGVWPRTSYLAKLNNPNPALETTVAHDGEHG
ncbi:MAG: 4Fe-4S dicluster domain-containing protein [Chloroflexi bacterium]|nr:MAG: 4Fe-4S dicluster domain-containing protein [Chloroflexota bacterium]